MKTTAETRAAPLLVREVELIYKVDGTRLTLYDKDGTEVLRFAEKP